MRIAEIWRRVFFLTRRTRMDEELAEEMRLHMDLRAAKLRQQGIEADDAARAARQSFGNTTMIRETSRDSWDWRWLEEALQDLRFGVRMLARTPGFAAIVVLTLGLGIGASTAIFNVVNGVLLAGLPFREPDRLVALHEKLGNRETSFSPPDYIVLTQQKDWFSSLGSFRNTDYEISGSGAPERITGAQVTASLFETLGVDAVMGRTFTDAEDNEGREVALLSHAYWKRKFGQDALVIGRGIRVDRRLYTVIGVLPPSFVFPPRGLPFNGKPAEVFVPMSFTAEQKQAYGMFYEARSERPTGSSRGTDKNRLRLTRLEPVWAWNRSRRIHGEKVPAVPGTTQPYSPLRIISRQAFLPPCPQNFFSTRALF